MKDLSIEIILLVFLFLAGSLYHANLARKAIFRVKLTRLRKIIIAFILIASLALVYFTSKRGVHYFLILSLDIYLISSIVFESISDRGINYRKLGLSGHLLSFASWEYISELQIDKKLARINAIKYKDSYIAISQSYEEEEMEAIEEFINKKMEKVEE